MEMKKALLAVLAGLFLIQSGVAQSGGLGPSNQELLSGDGIGGVLQEATNLAVQLTGVDQSLAEQNALQFWASLGLIFLVMYIVIEKGAELANVDDMLIQQGGHNESDSKKRLLGLTALTFLVFAGSTLFAPLISLLSTSIVIMAVAGFGLGIFYVMFGGANYLRGGGKKFLAGGKESMAQGTEAEAQAHQDLKEAERMESNVKEMEKEIKQIEGDMTKVLSEQDLDQTEQDIEALLSKFRNLEKLMSGTEQTVRKVLEDVHEEDSQLVKEESEIRTMIEDAHQKAEGIGVTIGHVMNAYMSASTWNKTELENAINSAASGPGTSPAFTSTSDIDVALQEVQAAAKELAQVFDIVQDQEEVLGKLEKVEESLDDELDFLKQELNNAARIEQKAEELAMKMGDQDDGEFIKREEQKNGALEKRFKELIETHNEMVEDVEKAMNQLSELEANASDHLTHLENLADELNEIEQAMQPGSGAAHEAFSNGGMSAFADQVYGKVTNTLNYVGEADNKIRNVMS